MFGKKGFTSRCRKWFIFTSHDYGRWEASGDGKILNNLNVEVGLFVLQHRKCMDCHYIQIERKEMMLGGRIKISRR